jgi:hypothetical protein
MMDAAIFVIENFRFLGGLESRYLLRLLPWFRTKFSESRYLLLKSRQPEKKFAGH